MGCDIHLFTERKRNINSKPKWANTDNWVIDPYFEDENPGKGIKYMINSACQVRDYSLFAILADVRNGSGNIPISEPKGLPEDASEVVRNESDYWGADGHSHSWLTMKELYDYWDQHKTVKYSGLVDKEGLKAIESGEMPSWWCQSSSIKDLTWKKWEHENDSLRIFIEDLEKHFFKTSWYIKDEDAENCRIVFWFDN